MRFLAVHFVRSSRPKVISPEVMSPETRVMSPEIYSHVARYFEHFEYDSKSLFNVKAYQYVSKAHNYYFDVKSIIIAHLL